MPIPFPFQSLPTLFSPPTQSFWDALFVDAALLSLSAILGGLVGWQREAQGRPAGLRTHILVCMGACLLTRVRFESGDPGRISAQIVTGIGFLGAGVILRRGVTVRGLTTAATIWVVAAIGIATGAGGHYAALSAFATILCLTTLSTAKRVEERIRRNPREATFSAIVPKQRGAVSGILGTVTETGASILSFESDENGATGERTLLVTVRLRNGTSPNDLTEALADAHAGIVVIWETDSEPVKA